MFSVYPFLLPWNYSKNQQWAEGIWYNSSISINICISHGLSLNFTLVTFAWSPGSLEEECPLSHEGYVSQSQRKSRCLSAGSKQCNGKYSKPRTLVFIIHKRGHLHSIPDRDKISIRKLEGLYGPMVKCWKVINDVTSWDGSWTCALRLLTTLASKWVLLAFSTSKAAPRT